jgi:hypothetical protein
VPATHTPLDAVVQLLERGEAHRVHLAHLLAREGRATAGPLHHGLVSFNTSKRWKWIVMTLTTHLTYSLASRGPWCMVAAVKRLTGEHSDVRLCLRAGKPGVDMGMITWIGA